MIKINYFILFSLLLFSLVGCSKQQEAESNMDRNIAPADIAAAIQSSQQGLPELMQITSEDTDFMTWVSDYYLLEAEQVVDGAICYADGVEASEIAVLLFENEKDCKTSEEVLLTYIQNRAGVFEGYAPQQAAMVKEGIIVANGRYVALLICPEPQAAKDAFLNCFGKSAKSNGVNTAGTNPEMENSKAASEEITVSKSSPNTKEGNAYNAEAVLQAHQSGDDSSLSEINRRILEAANEAIESEIKDDMTDYEKELAIHDYITGWSSFDYGVFGRSGSDELADGNNTPYGVLIDRSAMCHGYSSTFQLFMDMLDIECMTVFGTPSGNGVQHSWNMVKLDGEWYCVDCAWDDPIGGSPCHTYFNVTSDFLRRGSIHRWDESSVPEAVGTTYAYGNQ